MIDQWLNATEVARVTRRSDMLGAAMVALNWGLIAGVFASVAWWDHPVGYLLGAVLLGGRHMGLAVLMHEAGHGTLFRTPALNRIAGQWLCAYPVLADMSAYATSHREHHALAGTENDPDLGNYRAYPVSSESFRRKLLRDLSGQTGWRNLRGVLTGGRGDIMMRAADGASGRAQGLLVNGVLALILVLLGVGELYLMWLAGYLVFYQAIARIRQVAEHGAVADLYDADPRKHTRSIEANWLERLIFCPNRVHYHVEHHLLPSVPCYRLHTFHKLLASRGYFEHSPGSLSRSYRQMLGEAVPELAGVA